MRLSPSEKASEVISEGQSCMIMQSKETNSNTQSTRWVVLVQEDVLSVRETPIHVSVTDVLNRISMELLVLLVMPSVQPVGVHPSLSASPASLEPSTDTTTIPVHPPAEMASSSQERIVMMGISKMETVVTNTAI